MKIEIPNDEDMPKEEWRDIHDFPGYQVSDMGNVRCNKGIGFASGKSVEWRKMTPTLAKRGYFQVGLYRGEKKKKAKIHRIVAETFIPNPENKPQVAHSDGIKTNNRKSNLRWATSIENASDKAGHGTNMPGSKNPMSVLSEDDVISIREKYTKGYGTQKELAKRFGVSEATVNNIVKKRNWKHV